MGDGNDEIMDISSILKKLCRHLANNDSELTTSLEKISYKYLSVSSPLFKNQDIDELHVLNCVKHALSENPDSVKNVELLYNTLKKGKILKRPHAFLYFLLNLQSKDVSSSTILKELKYEGFNTRSQMSISSGDSEGPSVHKLFSRKVINQSSTNFEGTVPSMLWSATDSQVRSDISTSACHPINLSEPEIIQELIFSFQGIEGKLLRKEPGTGGFVIDPRYKISKQQSVKILRLAELGFLHNQVKLYCDDLGKPIGTIGQSLMAVLREELTEYYKLIAVLQTQLRSTGNTEMNSTTLTLHRLIVWIAEPIFRLQWLTNIALQCQEKKGGALISAVFSFLHHGAPVVKNIAHRILKAVCAPLLHMLTRWILDGQLDDPYGEFFIESRSIIKEERLWHDKYHVRTHMLPAFISTVQARKILATGKSINFLREICQDLSNLPGRDAMLRTFENINVEALFSAELGVELHKMMDAVYLETSKRVLDVMKNDNKLIEHMQAFRRYLLLGQGDFIRYLLELIAPELSKPAVQILPHTLSAIMDSAIRVTNTQFENPDTLKRLDVRLVEISKGDVGWDVFTILYHTNGPIGTVFDPTMDIYRMLFGALWKSKRMEFVLSCMWKRQITSAKMYRKISEMSPVVQNIHILTAEMIHFIHQTQYYFLFEVVECSWIEMLNRVNQAESLDDIIKAHTNFLQCVQCGIFLNSNSEKLRTQLLTIYNTILKLESIDESLCVRATTEINALNAYEKKITSGEHKEIFSLTIEDERKMKENVIKFNSFLQSIKTQVRSIAKQYADHVRVYLSMLASQSDVNLQLLSVRLDFNDYYSKMKSQLCQMKKNNDLSVK